MTPLPRRPPDLLNQIRDSQPSFSPNPQNFTNATDKSKMAHFETKVTVK